MKEPILIYGAGGLGKEVLSLIRSTNDFEPAGFIDDGIRKGTVIKGLRVMGGLDHLNSISSPVNLVLAVGDPSTKSMLVKMIDPSRVYFPVLIHPSAIVQDQGAVSIAGGSVIAAGCILTTDIRIGSHVLININTTVGHDVSIEDFASIMPGVNISGEVTIAEGAMVGSGTNIMNGIQIGAFSKVGMGSVVIHDVGPETTVAGVPAKVLNPHS
jgi:sugar O-acyltransferase (sialic acid O-acetyltransferase NeuD family)